MVVWVELLAVIFKQNIDLSCLSNPFFTKCLSQFLVKIECYLDNGEKSGEGVNIAEERISNAWHSGEQDPDNLWSSNWTTAIWYTTAGATISRGQDPWNWREYGYWFIGNILGADAYFFLCHFQIYIS